MKLRAALISVFLAALMSQAPAQAPDPDTVTLNFVNADIEGVVKAVSEITGKNFVVDPRVKGTINIVSARPVPRAQVYEVFLAALRLQGYAAVEDRGMVRIIPEADARLHPGRTIGPSERPRGAGDRAAAGEIQTQVFTLKYESAAQLLPVLRPLIAPANPITVYPATNTLVITDYAGNLQRIARIIDSIDQPGGTDPVVIPLQHASALDVALMVNRLFADAPQAAGAAGPDLSQRLSVVADARSNSLVARADNPSRIARLRNLVAMLDSPTSAAGNLHVVYLKNAEALKVAETLRAIYLGESVPAAAPRPMTLPLAATSAAAPAPGTAPALPALPGPQAVALSSGMIQADPATNSILINAPDTIYNNLRAALDKLDVRRAQVHVEALIAEITADKAAEFGVQWQDLSGAESSRTRGFGGTNFGGPGQNILGIVANPGSAGRGLNIGVIRGTVTIPGVGEVLNLGVLVRALETDSNANILSTPTLLTLDNEEARIVIGQNVPFITGQYALSGGATTPTPFQTVERRDVGLTLRVKPQISEGGTVRLQIYQEVSSVQDSTNPAGVITNKRAVESMVLVDDGQIVVIGGLIQDSVRDGVEKVPLLGDIPVLGALFTYKTRSRAKTNLMVFLRPTVLRDAQSADSLTGSRYDYVLGEQYKAKPPSSPPLPDMEAPSLPPRKAAPAEAPTPYPSQLLQ
ncbi:MAG TPA: type II secretion system secretin GspD [Burkholderiales bacterium]|nr:type II secretion system secretin GspD [Burkholderiales bacterium]